MVLLTASGAAGEIKFFELRLRGTTGFLPRHAVLVRAQADPPVGDFPVRFPGGPQATDIRRYRHPQSRFGADRIEPPLAVCVASNADHSFATLRARKECVIAIRAVALAPSRDLPGTSGCAAVSTCAEAR